MSTLTNISINARSLNGLIVISDGGGTTISDGAIITNDINANSFGATTISTTDLFLPRINANLVAILGNTINTATLLQNLYFDTTTRSFEIWEDNGTEVMFEVDTNSSSITFSNINTFMNSDNIALDGTVTFPRGNSNLWSLLTPIQNLNTLCQNLNFNITSRAFQFWNDAGSTQLLSIDCSSNNIDINTLALSIQGGTVEINSNLTITALHALIRRVNLNLITALGSTIDLPNLCQNLNFDTGFLQVWNQAGTSKLIDIDCVLNNITMNGTTTLSNGLTLSGTNPLNLNTNIIANSLTISPQEISHLDGVSSNLQTQLNNRGLINGNNTWSGANNTFSNATFFSATGSATFNGIANFNATANFTGASSVCNVKNQPENTNNSTAVAHMYLFNMIRSDGTSRNVSISGSANPNNRGANNFSLGTGVMQNLPVGTSTSDCVGIGINALNGCTQGYYCFAQGGGCLQFLTTGIRNVGIGYACFPNGNPSQSVCIGSSSGNIASGTGNFIFSNFGANALSSGNSNILLGNSVASVLSTGSNNIFIGDSCGGGITSGNNCVCLGASSTSSGNFTQSVAIGANSVINASNTIYLGTSNETTIPVGQFQHKSQYLHGESAQITANITLSPPFYEFYNIATLLAITITLPSPVSSLSGVVLNFRRTTTGLFAITSSAFFPITSNLTTTTALLTASSTTQAGNSIRLVCLLQTGTTYAWYQL